MFVLRPDGVVVTDRVYVLRERLTGRFLKPSHWNVEGRGLKTTPNLDEAIWYTRENLDDIFAAYPSLPFEWEVVEPKKVVS